MSQLVISGSSIGTSLRQLLMADEILPGHAPSYQLCKVIAAYHPLGAKMSDSPIMMAQSQARKISVPVKDLEDDLKEAFIEEWMNIEADKYIFNLGRLARIYRISTIALMSDGTPSDRPVNYKELWNQDIAFNCLDPLNTAGSLVLNQDPNSFDFQKVKQVAVGGQPYHRSRTVTLLNEEPLYIEYTTSAFGFVGRSVYQRALYPMKSFVQTLITDDLISLKSGVFIAKMKAAGSIVDQVMAFVAGEKRQLLKEAVIASVLSIDVEEEIETLNMQNIDGAYGMARKDILENIAVAADMPAKLLNAETFAAGFGEGTEDAKHVAEFVRRIRVWLNPAYAWMTRIVQHRAWSPPFFEALQKKYPDVYGKMGYAQAFYTWQNAFHSEWPNLLEEPDSEKIRVDDVKLKTLIAVIQVLTPILDRANKAKVVEWAQNNINDLKMLFPMPLNLDFKDILEHAPDTETPVKASPPFSSHDASEMINRTLDQADTVIASLGAHRRKAFKEAAGG